MDAAGVSHGSEERGVTVASAAAAGSCIERYAFLIFTMYTLYHTQPAREDLSGGKFETATRAAQSSVPVAGSQPIRLSAKGALDLIDARNALQADQSPMAADALALLFSLCKGRDAVLRLQGRHEAGQSDLSNSGAEGRSTGLSLAIYGGPVALYQAAMLHDMSRHLLMTSADAEGGTVVDELHTGAPELPPGGLTVPQAVKSYADALEAFGNHTERTRRQRGAGLAKTLQPPEYKKLLERTRQTAAESYKFVQFAKEASQFLSQDPPAAHSSWIESAGEGASEFMARTQLAPHQRVGQTATRTRDVQLQTMLRATPATVAPSATSALPTTLAGHKHPRAEAAGAEHRRGRSPSPPGALRGYLDAARDVVADGEEDGLIHDTVVDDLEAALQTSSSSVGDPDVDTSELEILLASSEPPFASSEPAPLDTFELLADGAG